MNITIFDHQSDLAIQPESTKSLIRAILQFYQIKAEELFVYFVDDKTMREMHDEHFDDPSPTDCMTFPLDDPYKEDCETLGEIFICPHTAIIYTQEHKSDVYEETSLYVIHCILHLLGYEDTEEAKRLKMKAEEAKCIEFLKKENLLLKNPESAIGKN